MSTNGPYLLRDGTFASAVEGSHVSFKQYAYSAKQNKKVRHVIIQHGAIEYHKRHMDLIEKILNTFKNSVVVSCMDLVGHGYSGGTRAYTDSIDSYVKDFLSFCAILSDLYHHHDVTDTHIIGHSLGGMIAIRSVVDFQDQLSFPIDSLILTNPCIQTKLKLPGFAKDLIHNLSTTADKVRFPSMYVGKDLTRDIAKAKSFDGDHLISNFMTTGMINAVIKACANMMPYSYYLKTPCLFILSGNDKIVDNSATKLFIGGIDKSLVKVLEYVGAKHDILNETCASEVFQEIIEYIRNDKMEIE